MSATSGRLANQPITPQQRQKLIEVHKSTGNMSQAMRAADIHSPRTAYRWWNRYLAEKEAELRPRSHARHTQNQLDSAIVEHICIVRLQEPDWGRRRIADALAERFGEHVSPGAVENALRRAGLWNQPALLASSAPQATIPPAWLRNGVDYEQLLLTVQEGIQLSLQSQVRAANNVLYQHVWRQLESDSTLLKRMLTTTQHGLSSWLLASRLLLGHSLMNSGQWVQSAHVLRQTLDWMGRRPTELRQSASEGKPYGVSLRQSDIWLGCTHHLGLMLAKQNQIEAGIGHLQTALDAIHRKHLPVIPIDRSEAGSLERDLAHLKLRLRRFPREEIHQHLHEAQQSAEDAGSFAKLAFTQFAWAKFYDRLARETEDRDKTTRQQRRNEMEQAIYRALAFVQAEASDRPMRLTLCYVDAAQLSQAHGIPLEKKWIQYAAEYCVSYGYGGQAAQLLAIQGVHKTLPEGLLRDLTLVVRNG